MKVVAVIAEREPVYPFHNFQCRGIQLTGPGSFTWFNSGQGFVSVPGLTPRAPCYGTCTITAVFRKKVIVLGFRPFHAATGSSRYS